MAPWFRLLAEYAKIAATAVLVLVGLAASLYFPIGLTYDAWLRLRSLIGW